MIIKCSRAETTVHFNFLKKVFKYQNDRNELVFLAIFLYKNLASYLRSWDATENSKKML